MNRHLTHPTRSAPALAALFFAFVFALAPAVRALDWDRTEIEQRADFGQPLPPYVFTCANSGTTDVTITELHPSCGCLTPVLEKNTLKPGESLKLTIGFNRTGYIGETIRDITIMTDEAPGGKAYPLRLVADLPDALTLAPRLVFWKKGERAKAKSIDVKVNLPRDIAITGATSNNTDMTVKLVTLKAGQHYRLDITPRNTATPRMATITLQPADPLPDGVALTVYAQVREK